MRCICTGSRIACKIRNHARIALIAFALSHKSVYTIGTRIQPPQTDVTDDERTKYILRPFTTCHNDIHVICDGFFSSSSAAFCNVYQKKKNNKKKTEALWLNHCSQQSNRKRTYATETEITRSSCVRGSATEMERKSIQTGYKHLLLNTDQK